MTNIHCPGDAPRAGAEAGRLPADCDPPGFAETGACSIRYRLGGVATAGAAPLVLLHELGGSLESWSGFVDSIETQRSILRYDMRGFGGSEKTRGPLSLDTLASDLERLLDVLGVSQPVALAGSALGAAVALAFAARLPHRTAAVVAMAPALDLAPQGARRAHMIAEQIERYGMRARVDAAMESAYPPTLRGDEARYLSYRARWLANDPCSYAAALRALAGMTLCRRLGAVRCPVRVLAGELDPNRSMHELQSLLAGLPRASFIALRSGHFMAVQTPAIVAGEVSAFLNRNAL